MKTNKTKETIKELSISEWTGTELNKRVKSGIVCIEEKGRRYHKGWGR